ncbi:MAG: LacI family transcriptional regulator [Lachnospiraceae bacterium]|nr:LacI family transcriptional regulator [Lachnospiraceae bacterium]
MVTLKEIAQRCNVSVTTVSNILNGKPKVSEETKKLVMDVVAELGYQPNYIAQGLRRQKTHTIGIIADDIAEFSTPKMIESIMACCEDKGYRTIVQNLRLFSRWGDDWYDKEDGYKAALDVALNELLSIKVDGIIYVASYARMIQGFPKDFPIPVVMAYAYLEYMPTVSVIIDDEKGGYDMTRYLLSMGHREIGVIGGRADNIHTQKRLLGYKKALAEAGINIKTNWIRCGAWDRKTGYEQMEYLKNAGVTAVFCMADQIAGGVYDYLEEQGLKVGEDISVVGFDNQDIAEYFRPALTTMKLPLPEIGRKSIKVLLNMLETEQEQNEKQEIYIPCQLIERASVKRVSC